MSWIVVYKGTLTSVCEMFDSRSLSSLNTDKYEAIEARDYLQRLNLSLNDGMTYRDKVERGLIKH